MHQLLPQFATARLPTGYHRDRIAVADGQWRDALAATGIDYGGGDAGDRLLTAIFGNSPYLTRCLLRDPAFAVTALARHPDRLAGEIIDELKGRGAHLGPTVELKRLLRVAKTRIALVTALADIAGLWTLEQVTGTLSRFAQTALRLACAHLLYQRARAGNLVLPGVDGTTGARPGVDAISGSSGFIVLAMGKLGAGELNYSSDIDLIAFFDPEVVHYVGKRDRQDCFNRITRELAAILQERTAEGYVFRVDLRLRPDAGATPVALSTDAAEIYYQSVGLNWERAAMIKARPIAGDLEAGAAFVERIAPFVWRKHLDYAALDDIQAIKEQIHSHHRHGAIAVAGHDIKLGRGGIREIEFFAQTQQLIAGGRDPSLRQPSTLEALAGLSRAGWVDEPARRALDQAYRFLRRLEHRLQMIDDQQTQKLPADDAGIAHVATFLGYPDAPVFRAEVLGHLRTVHKHYESLFKGADAPPKGAQLPFPGGERRADELTALADLRFAEPDKVAGVLQGWQKGRYRACRSPRARRLLKDITPALLRALATAAEPDVALNRFDEFLRRLPSGVQLFSLFHANPWLLELTAEIMGSAPGLASALGHNVLLLDAVLSPDFFSPLADRKALSEDLRAALARARDYEDILDISRRWTNERKFQIGVHVLRKIADGGAAGRAQSDLAEAVIENLLPLVEKAFAQVHGRLPGPGLAVVAMGKLGGRELTPMSDIDLCLIYEAEGEAARSDGARPLPASQYFARLSQRLIAALGARTGEGRLYEVDMRLRPSGQAGPIAVALSRFTAYQRDQAWTWEHMALTRARVIAGPPALARRIERAIAGILTVGRELPHVARDVLDMRLRLEKEFRTDDPWRVKEVRGGLQDIEFIAQYLQLAHAEAHPRILDPQAPRVFAKLADAGVLDGAIAGQLGAAADLLRNVQGYLRLCLGGKFDERTAPAGVRHALATAVGCRDFDHLARRLGEAEAFVFEQFQTIIGRAAPLSK